MEPQRIDDTKNLFLASLTDAATIEAYKYYFTNDTPPSQSDLVLGFYKTNSDTFSLEDLSKQKIELLEQFHNQIIFVRKNWNNEYYVEISLYEGEYPKEYFIIFATFVKNIGLFGKPAFLEDTPTFLKDYVKEIQGEAKDYKGIKV